MGIQLSTDPRNIICNNPSRLHGTCQSFEQMLCLDQVSVGIVLDKGLIAPTFESFEPVGENVWGAGYCSWKQR